MNTPICDFVRVYARRSAVRAHMPGHKGRGPLGVEALDITEVDGAGVLYAGADVIAQSEANAAQLFGTAKTLYSTEGSSLAVRAMLCLARLYAQLQGRSPRILAARNVHTSFLTGAALLDLTIDWLLPENGSVLSCPVGAEMLEQRLATLPELPAAVYITSPDYLGSMADVSALAAVCHRYGCLLLVDNAHGAYLQFLPEPRHPMALGADLCCDSAHKTLPVLTGGAYLHLAEALPPQLLDAAESAMRLFASTSPSYLILQSLDAVNPLLAGDWPAQLADACVRAAALRERLRRQGFELTGDEPIKLTLAAKAYGYPGTALAAALREQGVECEFADPDFCVLMLGPALEEAALQRIEAALCALPRKPAIRMGPPQPEPPELVCTPREALFGLSRVLPVEACGGCVLAEPSVFCPPAVPIAICGERLREAQLALFRYYGVRQCRVLV